MKGWVPKIPKGALVIVFASHLPKPEVKVNDRGCVLGVMFVQPTLVTHTDPDVIEPEYLKMERNHRADGRFKWPWGLQGARAWRFRRSRGDGKPDKVLTGETLPHARRRWHDIATGMLDPNPVDLDRLCQEHYRLKECSVRGIPFRPLQLKAGNALPDFNYLAVCRDEKILRRIPQWRPGLILFKPGVANDVKLRIEGINADALARLFGFSLVSDPPMWSHQAPNADEAHRREQAMLEAASNCGGIVIEGQEEYVLASEDILGSLIAAGGGGREVS